MLRYIIASFIFFLSANFLYAQKELQVLTPNAASLSKYAEYPVSNYTGIPQISIPLYTLKTNVIDIPIALSYHASGVRVTESPSWAGLGWTLNAGGVITRVVKGYPDDYSSDNFGFANAGIKSKIRASSLSDYNTVFDETERLMMEASAPSVTTIDDPISEPIDTEFDLFYYNFLGHTGKFTFNNEGKIHLLQESNLKIEYINKKFKITDGLGVVYTFNDVEEDNIVFSSFPDMVAHFSSSWNLTTIFNPTTSSEVHFNYQNYVNGGAFNNIDNEPAFYYDHMKLFDDSFFYGDDAVSELNLAGEPANWQIYFKTMLHQHQRNLNGANNKTMKVLSSIISQSDTVHVYHKYTKPELLVKSYISCILDSLTVNSSNNKVFKARFIFDFFEGANQSVGKYKLKSLLIDDKAYNFQYYETYNGKSPFHDLPLGVQRGRDLYGYYNGEDAAPVEPYFKPYQFYNYSETRLYNPTLFFATNNSSFRNPDWKYAQVGMLKEIQEPTGGKTLFEYEGNEFSNIGYLGANKIDNDENIQLRFDSLNTKRASAISSMNPYEQPATNVVEFLLHSDQNVSITTNIGMTPSLIGPNISLSEYLNYIGLNPNSFAKCLIKKFNNTTAQFDVIYERNYNAVDYIGTPYDDDNFNYKKNQSRFTENTSLLLSEGRYVIENSCLGPLYQSNLQVQTKFNYKTGNIYNGYGLRIKKISYLAAEAPAIVKNYSYGAGGNSSGVLETPIINVIPKIQYFNRSKPMVLYGFSGAFVERSLFLDMYKNTPVNVLNHSGIVIGYADVAESMDDGRKTVYHYATGARNPLNGYEVGGDEYEVRDYLNNKMYTNITRDNSPFRGILRETDYYDAANQIKKKVFSDYYGGEMPGFESMSMVLIPKSVPNRQPLNSLINPGAYSLINLEPSYVHTYGVNNSKLRDSIVNYFQTGIVTEVTRYEYNFEQQFLPVKITARNSQGTQNSTLFRYPKYFADTAIYNKMANELNIVEQVIEKKEYVNDNLVSAIKTHFGNPNGNVVVPSFVQKSIGTEPYKDEVKFLNYDSNGNLLSFKSVSGIDVCYVYSYSNKLLIAEIKNVNYNTIQTVLGGTGTISNFANSSPSDTEVINFVNTLRSSPLLKDALITTYTYKPLVGVTSQTDAKGMTTYYEYDVFGRLKYVRDQNGNILKQTDYHYKN
ncbi:RHS repeat domain-containing protein [Pedobacter sp. WC2501]|uniref:RHS repeat domain-containing protein n=1 Tax=Pedobacter sp. WC2501 TaxID=3461400 RepID=UPI0040453AD3